MGYHERDRFLRLRLRDLDLYLRLDDERERDSLSERERDPLPRLVNSLKLPSIPSREGKYVRPCFLSPPGRGIARFTRMRAPRS